MCKAAAKLKLLEYGLHTAANKLDEETFKKFKGKGREEEIDENFEERLEQIVENHLRESSSARRGDYKDGPVYQARKKVIEGFIKTAQGSLKRCSRPECGA